MSYDYVRAQRVALKQIAKFGGGMNNARLDRGGVQRTCTAAILQFTNSERVGSLVQFGDLKALVSGFGVTVPPSFEDNDVLLFGTFVAGVWQLRDRLRLVAPATELAPSGVVIHWELQVRR
jgi:hypothetical protein